MGVAFLVWPSKVFGGLGLPDNIVTNIAQPADAFALVAGGVAAPLWLDANDWTGVQRAAGDLRVDVQRVTGISPALSTAGAATPPSSHPVIIGTLGKSAVIDSLVASGKLDAVDLTNKWESFVITTISQPLAGVDQALVIAGSDKRGTIYGIYELSEQLGVSPWHWWADVPVKTRTNAYIVPGRFASGEPVVKYRGIFINDEAPAFTGWAAAKFGGVKQGVYTNVFNLLLRLRANYLWPAMWSNAFNEDDPADPVLADQYGIVMGTSHHEPMLRAQQEWSRHKSQYGNGQWDYLTNEAGLKAFWTDGIARNKNYESLVTVGMRGDGDAPMIVGGDMATNIALLSRIIADQRTILTNQTGRSAEQIPQVWALYKEVLDYYDAGMRVPEDITLLWPDDNWGNIRRLAPAAERNRAGGSGVYYHFDYVGGPRNYKWLNTNPLPKIQEQMNVAWQYGATNIWIVNVGDLKPMEVPIEFFLRMAWNPARWPAESTGDFLRQWATREFGAIYAEEAASLVAGYAKFNGRRKPELLDPNTFSVVNYREAERVQQDWRDLAARADALYAALPAPAKDAFYQLVLHPVKACSIVNDLYITTAFNRVYAGQQRASANALAAQAQALFQADAALVTNWNNTLLGGKWIHMMDQVHIGYTTWSDPPSNIMPTVQFYTAPATADLGVVIEGKTNALAPGAIGVLPAIHSEGGAASRYIDVFRRGTSNTVYSIQANQPWVIITNAAGTLGNDVRAEVSLDWSRVPTGSGEVVLTVQGAGSNTIRAVRLPYVKAPAASPSLPVGFLDPEGYIAIEAPNFDTAVEANGVGWKVSPDLGRTLGGVMPFPVTADSVGLPGGSSPHLEYNVYLRRQGEVSLRLIISPTLNFVPGRSLRCAISFDDQTPQIVSVGGDVSDADWGTWVRDSVRTVTASLISDAVGPHVFKFWMVDPGVVLQRIEIDTGGLKSSYLGPPESPRGRRSPAGNPTNGPSSSVVVEAESGQIGSDFAVSNGVPAYISITSNNTTIPGSAARVARYQVTFPSAGTYRLFARVRVGPGGANDDSLFLGNGFGAKNPTTSSDWKTANNFSGTGYVNLSDIVPYSNGGTAGAGVWKWVDISAVAGMTYTVPAGALTQTLDIGGREDGLDIDKFVFGLSANTFTVDDLMQGAGGTPPVARALTLEAELSQYGAGFKATNGTPSYLSVTNNNTGNTPGTSARVARFQPTFPVPGYYRLYARIRVGPGGASDDSLFLASSFGAKNPASATDWIMINDLWNQGFATSTDVVAPTLSGSAGTGVWKWVDLTKLANLGAYYVPAGALSQMLDLGCREDGLDIDKIVFAPAANVYTVTNLDTGTAGMVGPTSTVLTATLAEPMQVIDGFGASSAWTSPNLTDAQADWFFSLSAGLGLSLLRLRIAPDGTTSEAATAQKAVARGANVWATPWSPPAEWKSNGDVNNGGTLLPQYQTNWAARLADFVVNMQSVGVPMCAISAQNEPDYTATWESCTWTPAALTAFIRDSLGPALVARGVSTRVLAPEVVNWNGLASYADVLLADTNARPYVSHIATHSYGGTIANYPGAASNNLVFWQTEFSDSGATSDPTIDSALRVGTAIHDFLTIARGNAWHYWWLMPNGTNASTSALVENGVLAKRGWAMGNWSRFVRPGSRRVQVYGSLDTLRATAFISPASNRFVLVVVNSDAVTRTIPLAVEGTTVTSLTPWETSATRNLESLAPVTPDADGFFTLQVPARSITTFVGTAIPAPPTGLIATAESSSQITLSWSPSAGAASYNLKRATASGGPYTTTVMNISATGFMDTGLAAGTPYYYVVSAVNAGGESANSSQASATTWTAFQAWQMTYFGCTNCPAADSNADFDGDGMSNTNEFLTGTNPTNSASAFRILSVTPLDNDVNLVWQDGPGKTGVVQATSGEYSTNFTDISAGIVVPGSGITNHLDAGGATNVPSRFYRVRLAP
jgi:O-glycosyl hydrolase